MVKKSRNFPSWLLLGFITMFFAEVMAGSSNLWFLDIFGILLTLILYFTHILFYINVAVRTQTTSLVKLYFWGVLFALYEAPITQVLWNGYMDSEGPIFGVIGGIAINEFITLVFFWHPINSFIIPILIYESLSYSIMIKMEKTQNSEQILLPGHQKYLKKFNSSKLLVFLYGSILSINQLNGAGGELGVALGAILGTLFLILIALWSSQVVAKRQNTPFGIKTLILSTRSLFILSLFILIYVYIGGSIIISSLLPGRWPSSAWGYLTLLLVIIIVLLLILKTPTSLKKDLPDGEEIIPPQKLFDSKQLGLLFGFITLGVIIFSLLGPLVEFIAGILYFSYFGIGIILILINLRNIFK